MFTLCRTLPCLYWIFYSIISYGEMRISDLYLSLDILVYRFSWAQKRQDAAFLPGDQMVFFILNVIEAIGVLMTFKPFLIERQISWSKRDGCIILENMVITFLISVNILEVLVIVSYPWFFIKQLYHDLIEQLIYSIKIFVMPRSPVVSLKVMKTVLKQVGQWWHKCCQVEVR